MNKIHHTIELFLKKYQLDKPEKVYLCAFSGGYDSMCLLNSLKIVAPQNKIIAIHLNHNWRGEESDLEEQNCKDFCNRIRVEFYCEKLPSTVPHTETAARDARYNFFEKCKEKFESEIIFTAHNQNDNAETLIYRICKGTGIPGLCGIAEKRGFYYRPLLHTKREEIEKYSEILKNKTIKEIADRLNVSIAQLSIRYTLELGLISLPKATSVEHLKDNLDVNFKISSGDMKKLIELDKIENYGDYSFFPVFSGKLKE